MFCAGEWRRWAVLYLCGCAFLARFRFGPEAALGASPGQFDLGPGGFPQRAHGYPDAFAGGLDRKSTRLNSSHPSISYAVFCLKKKKKNYLRLMFKKKKKKIKNNIR